MKPSFPQSLRLLIAVAGGLLLGFSTRHRQTEKPSITPIPSISEKRSGTPGPTTPSAARDNMRNLYVDLSLGKPIDWKAALDQAKAASDPPLCAILIALWADANPLAAREWAEQAERWQTHPAPLTRIVAETWARKDPLAAMKGFVDTLYEVPIPQWAIFEIAAQKDMTTAKQLVAAFPSQFTTIGEIDESLQNFTAAAEALSALPPGEQRLLSMVDLVSEWMDQDKKDELKSWLKTEAAARFRNELKGDIPLLLGPGSFLIADLHPDEIAEVENALAGDPVQLQTFRQIQSHNRTSAIPVAPAPPPSGR